MGKVATAQALIVEDNSFSSEFLKAALQAVGIVSEVANDGLEAIHKLGKKKYQIVFMDCQMPNMDGFEAAKRIRSMSGDNASIPIIAISATITAQVQERCIRCGMNAVLQKPVSTESLKALIDRYMPNQRTEKENYNVFDLDLRINFKGAVSLLSEEMRISMEEASSLLQDFFRISKLLILNIEGASASGNQEDVAKYAHQIKGMASIMRLRTIQAVAERLEKGTGQMAYEVDQLKELLIAYRI